MPDLIVLIAFTVFVVTLARARPDVRRARARKGG